MSDERVTFFVQNNYVERLTAPIAIYARLKDIHLEDRSSFKGFNPDDCGIDWRGCGVILPYGSVQFIRQLKNSSLNQFIHHHESHFATSLWSTMFKEDALNGDGHIINSFEVHSKLMLGSHHLRPDLIDKAFAGGVFNTEKWEQIKIARNLKNDLSCWISPIKKIDAEWRCWIVGGKVVEISQYRHKDAMLLKRENSADVWSVAQSFANTYLPEPCVVIDIANVNDCFKVIEFNPIHCCGWYKADVNLVLDAWVSWSNVNMKLNNQSNQNLTRRLST